MNQSIFKAYDVRGVYPDEITKEDAYKIGFAVAKFIISQNPGKKLKMVVGEDCRIASPALRGAVVDALTKAGVDVAYIGLATTPLFYFSVNKLGADGGLMVTASHNPPQYGGLKIVGPEARPIGTETGLREIALIAEGKLDIADEPGRVDEIDLTEDYVNSVVKKSGIGDGGKLKIVIDAGNGMTPVVLKSLMSKLKFFFTPLYFDIDCNFPNHSPDISRAEALVHLRDKVVEVRADIGVAFDGDGDRVFFIDENGETVKSEFILALLYKNSGGFFSRPRTVYDLRVSKSVKELLGSRGIRSKTGHSFIKKVMRDNNADLGGESSGHFFFKEMGFTESSVLTMLKVIKLMEKGQKLSELTEPFRKYFHSGEINMPIVSREQGVKMMERLKEKYKDGKIDELDGLTVEFWDGPSGWWFNLRLSNTEPIIRLVVETEKKDALESRVREISSEIKKTAI